MLPVLEIRPPALTPSLCGGTLSPGDSTYNICPVLQPPDPPTPKGLLVGLFSIKAVHTHLLRGSEVSIQAGDTLSSLKCILIQHGTGEDSHTYWATNKKISILLAILEHYISSSEHFPFFSFFPSRSVWQLRHVSAECVDRRRGSSLRCLFGLAALPAASPGPKGITRPSSICLRIPQ